MNLSIDFNSLTLDEADAIEEMIGIGIDAIGAAFSDPKAPKVKAMKALAMVAYARQHSVTFKKAAAEVGKIPLSEIADAVEVEAEEHPTVEPEQSPGL